MNDTIKIGYMGKLKLTHGFQAANGFRKILAQDSGLKKFNIKLAESGYASHTGVVDGIINSDIELGVIAIENSYEGIVADSARLLRDNQGFGIKIICELRMLIKHFFVTRCKKNQDIKIIYSHPTAYGQCRKKINQILNFTNDDPFCSQGSTEQAAIAMLKNPLDSAAIVTQEASRPENYPFELEKNGLRIIGQEEGISDVNNLCTRFFVIGKNIVNLRNLGAENTYERYGGDKRATVLFTLTRKKSGELLRSLNCFCKEGINLSVANIFPCPINTVAFEYNFLIDCDLYLEDLSNKTLVSKKREFINAIKAYNNHPDTVDAANIIGEYPILDII